MTSASASSLPTEFLSASLQKVIESKLPDNIWIKLNIPIKNIIETINGILEVGYEYDSDDTGETFLLEQDQVMFMVMAQTRCMNLLNMDYHLFRQTKIFILFIKKPS